MSYLSYLLSNETNPINSCSHIEEIENGVLKIVANNKTNDGVIISCGIHGNETAPIEIMNDLLSEIINKSLIPATNLLFIFGNLEAMKKQERFLDFNLNRLFNGNWQNYPNAQESVKAKSFEDHVNNFAAEYTGKLIHLDLHTAIAKSKCERFAILPKKNGTPYEKKHFQMLSSLGLDALVLQSFESTTFSAFTEEVIGNRGMSATVELGKVMPFGQNKRKNFKAAEDALRFLFKTGALPMAEVPKCFQVSRALIKDFEDYKLCLTSEDINFTQIEEGRLLEEKENEKTYAGKDEHIIFPNQNVKVGQRSGLIITPVY